MQLTRGIHKLNTTHRPSVVSIGNYDGVHLGHQQVVNTLLKKSAELRLPSTVVTFEPFAKEFFMPGSVLRLNSIEQRAEQLFALGVQQVLCLDFTAEFAAYSPQQFVQEVLIESLGVRYLCVGDDFRFGKDRAGDFDFLKTCGLKHGFSVTAHETFNFAGKRVSSGRIRDAIQRNNFALAESLLGRPYSMSGTISRGRQLGRTLDYPTANLILDNANYAIKGVYVVRAQISSPTFASRNANGVANVGSRPTVNGKEHRLEVHLFDFEDDIYGAKLEVQFLHKIRDEQSFDSLASLKQQIEHDTQLAKAYCLNHPSA